MYIGSGFSGRRGPLVLACAWFCFSSLVSSAQPVPVGLTQTRLNETTTGTQQHPAVATGLSGHTIVAWESQGQDGDGFAIVAVVYDDSDKVVVAEFIVNSTTDGDQRLPAVAMAGDGDFIISWASYSGDSDGWDVYYALYDSTGAVIKGETMAHPTASGQQTFPATAMTPAGESVLAWIGDGDVYATTFDAAGSVVTAPFLVNADVTTATWEAHPDVGNDADGNFVVAWQSAATDGSGTDIYARRFDAPGLPRATSFVVNTYTLGNQTEPAVAVQPGGAFTVVWSSYAQDGDAYGVYGQRYDDGGIAKGTEFIINTTTAADQLHPVIAATPSGKVAISWTGFDQDGDKAGVYAQSLDADGVPEGSETLVNNTTDHYQMHSALAWYDDGTLPSIVWQDGAHESDATNDGSRYGIYSARLPASLAAGVARDSTVAVAARRDVAVAENIAKGSSKQLIIYPNPFSDAIRIAFVPANDDKVEVTLYHLSGKKVADIFSGEVSKSHTYVWSYKADKVLPAGIYQVRIRGNTSNIYQRVAYRKVH